MNVKSSTTSFLYKAAAIVMIAMLALAALPVMPAFAAPSYGTVNAVTLGAQTGTLTYGTGSGVTFAITVTEFGAGSATTTLTAVGLPAGASASFNVAQPMTFNTTQNVTMTVTTSATTPAAVTAIHVNSSSGNVNSGNQNLTVGAKALTITGLTANNKVYDRTTTATLSGTAALSGVVNSDVVTLGGSPTATFATGTVANGKAVTVSGYTISGAGAGNYTLTQPAGLTANITAKALTAQGTLAASTKVYTKTNAATLTGAAALQAAEAAGTGTTSDGKPYTGDTVTLGGAATGTFASVNVANGITVNVAGLTISGANSGNYTLTQPTLTANITARPLVITAQTNTKTYDGTTSSATNASLTSGVVQAGDSAPATWTQAYSDKNVGAGNKTLTPNSLVVTDGNSGNNYSYTYTSIATGTITAKALSMTGLSVPASKVYDGTTAAVVTDASAFDTAEAPGAGTSVDGKPYTGDTVNFTGTAVGTYNSATVAGAATVTFTGLSVDNTNYTLTMQGPASATITKATADCSTVAGYTVNYNGSSHTATGACTGVGGGADVLTGLDVTATTHTNAGSYIGDAWSFTNANYSDASGTVDSSIAKVAADCSTVTGYTVNYNGSSHTATGACTGVGGGADVLTGLDVTATTHTNVGSYIGDAWSFTNANYSDASGTVDSSIAKVAADCSTVAGYTVNYNGSSHTATGACTGVGGGADVLTGLDVTATTHTNAGSYIGDAWSFTNANYSDANGTVNSSIAKVAADCSTVAGYSVSYDGSSHTATGACTGLGGGADVLTGLDVTATTHTNAGTYNSDAWSFTNANYSDANGTVNSSIAKVAADCSTVAGYSVSYDGSSHTATGACTGLGGGADVLTGLVLTATTHTNAGTYNSDAWSFTNTNYSDANGTVNSSIAKIAASVTAVDNSKLVSTADPALTTTNSGFLAGDLGAGKITFSASRAAGEAINTYVITPAADDAGTGLLGNYNVTLNNGTFTISDKSSQTISFGALADKTYGAADFSVSATATSSLAVSFASQTASVCTVSGSTVHLVTVGTCTVRASQSGDGSFLAAPDVDQSFAVNKAALTVTADSKSINVGDADPAFTFVYSGFVNGEGANALTTAPSCSVSGAHSAAGSYAIVCSGGAATNYSFTYVNGTLTVNAVNPVAIFADVPFTYWANSFIERLYNAGITGGCSAVPLNYCPDASVTRAQMAIFLLRGIHGSSYSPPAVGSDTGFTDVAVGSFADAWIKQLAAEGITGGCGVGLYCPNTAVTRAQMAIFLLRSEHGSSYAPPTGTGIFTDVPSSNFAFDWIEQLSAEGITSGCGTGLYCPNNPVTRAQMAVFLVKTFNLP